MIIEIGPNLTVTVLLAPFVWYGTRFLWRMVNTRVIHTGSSVPKGLVIEP